MPIIKQICRTLDLTEPKPAEKAEKFHQQRRSRTGFRDFNHRCHSSQDEKANSSVAVLRPWSCKMNRPTPSSHLILRSCNGAESNVDASLSLAMWLECDICLGSIQPYTSGVCVYGISLLPHRNGNKIYGCLKWQDSINMELVPPPFQL